eukprot:TRINITY_DN9233_c0_g1_i1.p1 TRINITY_DN9233_c0_g1~~TRINITY_DN9233_c0_g1_i1.p1  ORF type:complete len:697 (-),score=105.55 TRINITY_DN9233_c0_g1_i1:79-2169(-)
MEESQHPLSGLAQQLRSIADSLESLYHAQIPLPKEDGLLLQWNGSDEPVEVWSPDDQDSPDLAMVKLERKDSRMLCENEDEAGGGATPILAAINSGMLCEHEDEPGGGATPIRIAINSGMLSEDENETKGGTEFMIRAFWDEQQIKTPSSRRKSSTSEIRRLISFSDHSIHATAQGIWQYLIAGPGSLNRTIWDCIGGILIVYDVIVIPLGFFDLPEVVFLTVMDWVTLFYWSLNIFNTLTQGYVRQGSTIMAPRKILARYLSSWFWLDLVTLLPDWLFSVVISDASFNGNSVRLLRIARLTRTVRLLRVLRLKQLMESLDDLLDSEVSTITAAIVKMLLLLLVINHYIACNWYLISWLSSDAHPDDTWVKINSLETAQWWRQYLVAYHWSITQFTPASMPVQPGNPAERAFAITVVVFALVGFSYVVGSITGSLTQLRSLSEKDAKQFWLLRRFLRHKNISFELSLRIRTFLDFEVSSRRGTVEMEEVEILRYLSNHMRSELHFEVHKLLLLFHPLFSYMNDETLEIVQTLCHSSISSMSANKLDVVFQVDHRATCSFFLSQGALHYNHQTGLGGHNGEEIFPRQTWISEPAMWVCEWMFLGDCAAKEVSTILCLDVAKTERALERYSNQLAHIQEYAKRFVAWLNDLASHERSDVMIGDGYLSCFQGFLPARTHQPEDHIKIMRRLRRLHSKNL